MRQAGFYEAFDGDAKNKIQGLQKEINKEREKGEQNNERLTKLLMEQMLQSMKLNQGFGKRYYRPW